MKIHYQVTKPYKSTALKRIEDGIKLTLPPDYQIVSTAQDADIVVLPVVSINDAHAVNVQQNTIILQLCHLSAGGSEIEWQNVWQRAGLVVSYLQLPNLNYLRMPLGYDPDIFFMKRKQTKYRAIVTGYVDMHEGGEVIKLVHDTFKEIIHLGRDFALGAGYHHAENVSDNQLRSIYNCSDYVIGMRMVEGFELPLIEGAACGCVPVALDLECYRRWFRDLALFVDPSDIEGGLREIAETDRRIEHDPMLIEQFTWQGVMLQFWTEVRSIYG